MSEPQAEEPSPTLLDRISGGVLVLAATALIAVLEAFYVALRLGSVRIPISVGIAVVCHPLLVWLMRAATGSTLAMLATFGVWLAVIVPLSFRRAEADLVITGDNWVSTVLMFGGSLLFVGSIGALLPARPRASASARR